MDLTGINPVGVGIVALIGIWAAFYAVKLLLSAPLRLKPNSDAVEGQRDAGPAVFIPFHGSEVSDV